MGQTYGALGNDRPVNVEVVDEQPVASNVVPQIASGSSCYAFERGLRFSSALGTVNRDSDSGLRLAAHDHFRAFEDFFQVRRSG